MALSIYVKIDVPEALRRGVKLDLSLTPATVRVTIPDLLNQEERDLIAKWLQSTYHEKVKDYLWTLGISTLVPEPTVAGVISAIRAHEAQIAEKEAKQAAEREATIRRRREGREASLAAFRGHLAARLTRDVYGEIQPVLDSLTAYTDDGGSYYDPEVDLIDAERADLEAWRAEISAENARRKAEKERLKAGEDEARRKKAEAYTPEREAWIAKHGSARLRRLVAEKIEHDAVYQDERLALERPGWVWSNSDYKEPRNAPQSALDLLDEARKTAPDAKLRYRSWWRKATEDEEAEADRDGEVFREEHRCLSTFLDRLIVTRDAAKEG